MKTKQHAGLGFLLALTTAMFWGALPLAMKPLLSVMDPFTIVWYRFIFASLGLLILLMSRRQLVFNITKSIKPTYKLMLFLLAAAGLFGNFVLYSSSLQYLSPTASQVIVQLSPVGMMIGSVLILKERMRMTQIIGALLLVGGLLMFFNANLIEIFTRLTDYTFGVLLGVYAALAWVCYGIAQKILLRHFTSQHILLVLYTLCALALSPLANPAQVVQLDGVQWLFLLFCGVNTLIGYGALAEAMARWQAAQVSAVITLTPLFTLFFSELLALVAPSLFGHSDLNILSYIGAFVVVAGAMFAAIGHYWWQRRQAQRVQPC